MCSIIFLIFVTCQSFSIDKANNFGKHFIVGFTSDNIKFRDDYIGISILALDDTNVTIIGTLSGKPWSYTVFVKGGGIFEHKLPVLLRMDKSKSHQNGIEVSSTSDISLVCLNYQRWHANGADAYLALPTWSLGLVYVVASYSPISSSYGVNIAVISAYNNNTIIVFPNKNAVIYYNGVWHHNTTSLSNITVVLEKLETLYISASSDLSGTIVKASKPVSVISSMSGTRLTTSLDFLETFLLPKSQWGHQYLLTTVRNTDKTQGDIFRIFAYENNTMIETINWTKTLSSGEYEELISGKSLASFVNCSKPCQVMHYIRGERIESNRYGFHEASMMVLPSISQFLSYYRVVLPFRSEFHDSITLVIQNDQREGLYMDGKKLNGLSWKMINGTKYVWTVITFFDPSIVTVYHTSSAVRFGLYVFGWSLDTFIGSYAYAAGYALKGKICKSVSEKIKKKNPEHQGNASYSCMMKNITIRGNVQSCSLRHDKMIYI